VYSCVTVLLGEKAGRERQGMQRLSFHSFPDVTTDRGKMWITKIRRDPGSNFVIYNNTKVCSLHFIPDDYTSGDLQSTRQVLKGTAIPLLFPWTREICQRTTTTSRLAASVYQKSDLTEEQGTPVCNSEVSYCSEENCMEGRD